jgi:hypothetical protein
MNADAPAGLERQGIRLERQNNTFRVAAIPRNVERAFSKRRQAIEEAARVHGYSTTQRDGAGNPADPPSQARRKTGR